MLWLTGWTNLQNYFDNLINRRLWLWTMIEPEEEQQYLPNWVNLNEYEKELQNMEYEEAHKNERLQWLKNTLAKLNEYLKKFKDKWRDDMLKKIKKDIESTQKEIDSLEK
jgi:DNA polymerase II large subunit